MVIAEALACGTPVLISDKVNGWQAIEQAGIPEEWLRKLAEKYLTDDEKADNDQILLCCSRARSDTLVLDI